MNIMASSSASVDLANKQLLSQNVKSWLQLENEMRVLTQELKTRKLKKKELTSTLLETMKKNNIDCFDISDGKIMYMKNKVKGSLSKTYLADTLAKYFIDEPNVETDELVKYLLSNRSVTVKEDIRLKGKK